MLAEHQLAIASIKEDKGFYMVYLHVSMLFSCYNGLSTHLQH
jgi:hypothetical protein